MTILLLLAIILLNLTPALSQDKESEHTTEELRHALTSPCVLRKLYRDYLSLHGHIRPPHQEQTRLQIFKQEIKEILELRANTAIKWEAGINLLADMNDAERQQLKGYYHNVSLVRDHKFLAKRSAGETLSVSVDDKFDNWRIKGLIGKAPNQLKNDCWAHAAVVPVEAETALYRGKFIRMSVQELYDCSYPSDHPIDDLGGNPVDAWRYIAKSGRLGTWKESPESKKREMKSCVGRYDKTNNAIDGYLMESVVKVVNEKNLLQLIKCTSPIVVGVDTVGSHLGKYVGKGLFNAINCHPVGDHTLVVVGYNPEALIIRNSWGKGFGLNGYVMWDRKGETCCMYDGAFSAYLIKKKSIKKSKRSLDIWDSKEQESCINWAAVPRIADGEEYY